MRTDLNFPLFRNRPMNVRTMKGRMALTVLLVAGQAGLFAQESKTPPPPPPSSTTSDAQLAAQQATIQPVAPKSTAPDYPDPRGTVTIGLYYWATANGTGPNLTGGSQAPDYETLDAIGKPKAGQAADLVVPISRTGAIHLDYARIQGTGSQTLKVNDDLLANQFYSGNYLATTYKLQTARIYLDDLFWPHKFPVSRLRVKSLWGFEYMTVNASVNAPLAPQTDAVGNAITTYSEGSRSIYLPSLGMAAEYAVTPHVLLRADVAGFGLHHKAEFWDASATLAWRRSHFEVVGGFRALQFKTSPNNVEYLSGRLDGAFVGLRYHLY